MPLLRSLPDGRALAALGLLAVLTLVTGCEDEEVPPVEIYHPTLVEVTPAKFLGPVPCVAAPGAMRRYVATVFDVGESLGEGGAPAAEAFALPSSTVTRSNGLATPMPCTQSVGFSRVIAGHHYYAEIDGYDRDDLVAIAPGARILYDPITSERVGPRWTVACSKENPVLAIDGVTRTIGTCGLLSDGSPGTETLIEVRVDGALGGLECGEEPGMVTRFEIAPPGLEPLSAACGEAVTFTAPAGAGTSLEIPLLAFETGASEPSWGTTCVAQVLSGVTASAACLALVAEGALEVDPEDALAALGLACAPASFEEMTVEMTDGPPDRRYVDDATCATSIQFQGRAGGLASARATITLGDGTSAGSALCSGVVIPGGSVHAICEREP